MDCLSVLTHCPAFCNLTTVERQTLTTHFSEVCYEAGTLLIKQGEMLDALYFIAEGEVALFRKDKLHHLHALHETLKTGDVIGLDKQGAVIAKAMIPWNVMAISSVRVFRLTFVDLNAFLEKFNINHSLYRSTTLCLRMLLIKKSMPFSKLSHERVWWLAEHIEEVTVKAGDVIFAQGAMGQKCYLIKQGRVEITSTTKKGKTLKLSILHPPSVFGESPLMTQLTRNATAIALEDSTLLQLSFKYLTELLESDKNVAEMFMTLTLERSRPIRNEEVHVYQYETTDKRIMTVLKDIKHHTYFELSEEGYYIWQLLDGDHSLQDITLKLTEKFSLFSPELVIGIISKLAKAHLISGVTLFSAEDNKIRKISLLQRMMDKIFHAKWVIRNSDPWLSQCYRRFIHYFFTKAGFIILSIIAFAGFVSFSATADDVLLYFSIKHESLFLLLILLPFSYFALFLHELGHVFSVKYYQKEVNYIGIRIQGMQPFIFVDTSDMWLLPKTPRLFVTAAGLFMDVLLAGIMALLIWVVPHPYLQGMFWLFALYTYLGAFRRLSPFEEKDGYYLLMDTLEKKRLRSNALRFFGRFFSLKLYRQVFTKAFFKNDWQALIYWFVCLLYLLALARVVFILQGFVLSVWGVEEPYSFLTWIVPTFLVLTTVIPTIKDIIQQVKNEQDK